MKEVENIDWANKRFYRFFNIFNKNDKNEIKKDTKKQYLIYSRKNRNIIPKNYIDRSTNKTIFLSINKLNNSTMKSFNVFNIFNGKDITKKEKQITNDDLIKSKQAMCSYNNFITLKYLYYSCLKNALNTDSLTNLDYDDETMSKLENEYVIVNKVYTTIKEDDGIFILIY